jgi:hypothetical protein
MVVVGARLPNALQRGCTKTSVAVRQTENFTEGIVSNVSRNIAALLNFLMIGMIDF